ncbi:MAG: cytochrome c oxidase subunit 2A [Caldilineaceae bacterium]|nr:cytochrome c oxidase subunit 2A [Caldilineaceae bacterium]
MKQPEAPRGTIALLLLYFVIIILMWGNVYMTMLSRGATQ